MDQTGRPSQDLLRLLAAARGEGHRPQQATNRPDGRLHRPTITGADDCGYNIGIDGTNTGALLAITRTRAGVPTTYAGGDGADGHVIMYLPDELHVSLGGIRRPAVRAFWNGCAYLV